MSVELPEKVRRIPGDVGNSVIVQVFVSGLVATWGAVQAKAAGNGIDAVVVGAVLFASSLAGWTSIKLSLHASAKKRLESRTPEALEAEMWEWSRKRRFRPSKVPEKDGEDFRVLIRGREGDESAGPERGAGIKQGEMLVTVIKPTGEQRVHFHGAVKVDSAVSAILKEGGEVFKQDLALELLRRGLNYRINSDGDFAVQVIHTVAAAELRDDLDMVRGLSLVESGVRSVLAVVRRQHALFTQQGRLPPAPDTEAPPPTESAS